MNEAAIEISRPLPELRRVFNTSEDKRGLSRTLLLEAVLHWNHARSAAAEDACRRAAEYARNVNDQRELAEILGWLASAAPWGPTPHPKDTAMQGVPR